MNRYSLSTTTRRHGLPWGAIALIVWSCAFGTGIGSLHAGQMLFDFGAPDSLTQPGTGGPVTYWNNVTAVGLDPLGTLFDIVDTEGTVTDLWLSMWARFNGANENGTLASSVYPSSATRDSLYGNTEERGGQVDVFPEFVLSGLTPGTAYDLSFYASRTGVSDNRETRYTVTGSNSAVVDLDVANNVDATVSATGITPSAFGEITIRLEPGPNNNNTYHFTYLGLLRVDLAAGGQTWLFDFGSGTSETVAQEPQPETYWNNVPTTVGADNAGTVGDLVTTEGAATGAALQMVSRFNGANQNGTTAATVYPSSATRDSLFGNTEAFSGLENVLPIFKLMGLTPGVAYDLVFYASRMGVGNNRETRYTVTGATEAVVDLNVALNVDQRGSLMDMQPDAAGELTVALTPGPNNDNGNHFTYLGVLQLDWEQAAVHRASGRGVRSGRESHRCRHDRDLRSNGSRSASLVAGFRRQRTCHRNRTGPG